MNRDLEMVGMIAGQCELCELHKGRLSPVFDRGVESGLLICGMVPGPDENKAGIPFIGRAGQLLDEILEDVELLDKVYITNLVKCALKPGIKLKQEWIDSCLFYFMAQIELVRPKVVVTLGGDATNGVLGNPLDTKIGSLRGRAHKYHNIFVVPTYHPSFLIRGGGTKHPQYEKVLEDFEMAKFILEDSE